MRIPSGVTDQYIYFVAVDATDLKTREIGLSGFTVYRSRNGGAAAAYTTPTINETDSTNMPGVYEILLDEDMSLDAGDQSQEVALHITHASMAPVTRVFELYRPSVTAGETLTVSSGNGNAAVQSIANNAITAASIADNAIDAGAIASDAITAAKIATGAITAAKFAAGAIDAAAVADGAIDAGAIAADAITAAKIADGAIDAATFAAGAINAAAIAADALTAAKVAADVGTEIAAAVAAHADIAAIKAKTDNLPSDPADASVVAGLIAAAEAKIDIIDGIVDSILVDTAEIGAAGAGLTEAGGTGDHLTAVPWNAAWDAEVQSAVADGLAAYDPPTRAEATSDKDEILAVVAVVDGIVDEILVDTGTTLPATLAAIAGYVDTEVALILSNIAALNNLSAAQVNAEIVDALSTDTHAEPGQGAPAATASLKDKIGYLYKDWRNKKTQTADEQQLFADDGATVDQKRTVSDDGLGTTTRGEMATGA